mmetsp:Transcript_59242/g.129987  ORF Transcript_59242/g.129987 Transcript_59242/m.129987 type:complete len:277 (-) Transcript_59242:473-1303(-)
MRPLAHPVLPKGPAEVVVGHPPSNCHWARSWGLELPPAAPLWGQLPGGHALMPPRSRHCLASPWVPPCHPLQLARVPEGGPRSTDPSHPLHLGQTCLACPKSLLRRRRPLLERGRLCSSPCVPFCGCQPFPSCPTTCHSRPYFHSSLPARILAIPSSCRRSCFRSSLLASSLATPSFFHSICHRSFPTTALASFPERHFGRTLRSAWAWRRQTGSQDRVEERKLHHLPLSRSCHPCHHIWHVLLPVPLSLLSSQILCVASPAPSATSPAPFSLPPL